MIPERGFYWRRPRIGLLHGVTKTSEMRNLFRAIFLAGVQGVEPRLIVLETIVFAITPHSYMEPVTGIEPVTYSLQVNCSSN